MADLFDYIFQFPSQAAALADSIVGPYFNSPPLGAPVPVLVYRNTQANSVVPEAGFWFLIETVGNATLAAHPNLQIANDAALMRSGQPSVVSATFDTSHTNIVFSNFGTYCANGLALAE